MHAFFHGVTVALAVIGTVALVVGAFVIFRERRMIANELKETAEQLKSSAANTFKNL